ncbi:MAG: PAS domain-containing protein [Desulfuromonadales bacterium]|nr:PAS domain-containing protein [Desulfuromonadales bacterium]
MQAKDTKLTISGSATIPEYQAEPKKRVFWFGFGIIAVVAVVAIIWVSWGLKSKEQEFEANLQKRLELMAATQVKLTEALFETAITQANRVINSELFKLYAAEVHLIEGDVSLLVSGPLPGHPEFDEGVASLSAQLPMMQSLLLEFTRISGYLGGRVVNRNGTVYIATDASTTPLRTDQMSMAKQVLQSQVPKFGPLQYTGLGLVLEAFLPIFPPDASGLDQTPVAVLMLTKVVSERIHEMHTSSLLEQGERIRLVQKATEGYEEIVPWLPGQLQSIGTPLHLDRTERLPFAVRTSLTGVEDTYSLGVPITGPDWWVIVEANYDVVREALRGQEKSLMSIAVLLILFFGVAFGAVWALLVSNQERKVAKHFEHLAQEIEKQRQLLDRINNTISDYIVLKDLQGRYLYVNPAFAEAVGKVPQELIGLDNEAVFGYDTARRLEHSDQQVLTSGEPVTFSETLYLRSEPHHLQISKAALKDAEGKPSGVVSVIRDVTEIVEVQKRHEQATAKTVEALVRAIELTDPYLAGHSRLMGNLGVEVAKAMNASDLDISTVETAANLSQVGKLFVDRELLFKAEALTAEEKEEMAQHVEHAAKVLEDIDFGLPIFDAVYQMNETLDGQGYPKGLKGDEISLSARILAVVNSFCAMVEPRAYRGARSIDESLAIIESGDGVYDNRVVTVLKEVVKSAIGEKILAKRRQD